MGIKTDDMDLAGDIVQSLATYLDVMVGTEPLIMLFINSEAFL